MKKILYLIIMSFIFTVDYESQVQPIFDSNCINCHNPSSQAWNNHQLNLTSYDDFMPSSTVVAGNHSESDIYDRITRDESEDGNMPPSGSLNQTEIDLIADWIDEGALSEEFNDIIGCTDLNAITCDDDINYTYFPECTICSEGIACDNYYNSNATVDNGECMYNDVPEDNELSITFQDNSFYIEWFAFEPPVDVLSYTLFRCIDEDGIINGDGTDYSRCAMVLPNTELFIGNEFFDSSEGNDLETYVVNGNGLLKYTFSVHYPNNNYWGSANGAYYYEELEECTAGDVSNDGIINVLDIVSLVNHILGSSSLNDVGLCAADLNSDGIINVIDIVSLVNIILS